MPRLGVDNGQGAAARPGELSLPLPLLTPEEYRQLQDGVRLSRLPRYHLLCAHMRRELEAAPQAQVEVRRASICQCLKEAKDDNTGIDT